MAVACQATNPSVLRTASSRGGLHLAGEALPHDHEHRQRHDDTEQQERQRLHRGSALGEGPRGRVVIPELDLQVSGQSDDPGHPDAAGATSGGSRVPFIT
jgi:hypothetical protein